MMRVQVQSFRAPRWLGPLLVLIALAILPFALILGMAVMALVAGASIFRLLLPAPRKVFEENLGSGKAAHRVVDSGSRAIDADYEVKDEYEKGN